jgi:predicted nucleotidyltransferase
MDPSYRLALRIVIYAGIALSALLAVLSVILSTRAPSAASADIFIQPRSASFVEEAYLYGSFARNQQDAASDVDVLVIGKPKSDTLAEIVQKLERQLGREINYTVLTRKELESRRGRKDAFLENVWHNKRVLLVGAA